MPLILPGNVATATAATSFSVDNSCRFDGSTSFMEKDQGTPTDRDKFTMSFWIKRGNLDTAYRNVLQGNGGSTDYTTCTFNSSDQMDFGNRQGAGAGGHKGRLITNRRFRDPAAWYHFVCVWDSGNASAGDRMKMYVNGVEETSFATDTNPVLDEDPATDSGDKIYIGAHNGTGYFWDGYMAEVYFCDGQAYGPTDFGEFDSDSPTIWKPKDASGDLTFGNNGFYLDFKDSANLGNDANGGTDLAETGLDATDSSTDTPTNNFCTINSLDNYWFASTLSEGNCKTVTGSSAYCWHTTTMGLTAGKWYWEVKHPTAQATASSFDGIVTAPPASKTVVLGVTNSSDYSLNGNDGKTHNGSGTGATYAAAVATNGIVGVALDLDNNKIYYSHNGAWGDGSGSWDSTTFDAAVGAVSITAAASTASGFYFPAVGDYASGAAATFEMNFGGCPAFAISSAQSDDNDLGIFEYDPPTGFLAICTKNLGSDGG